VTLQVYLLNKPEDAVLEMLDGLVASVPHLQRLDGFPEASTALAVCSRAENWSHCCLPAYYYCTVLEGRVCYLSYKSLQKLACGTQVKVIVDSSARAGAKDNVAVISGAPSMQDANAFHR